MRKINITVAGNGVVGSAIVEYFKAEGRLVEVYDPPKGLDDMSVLQAADIVFIAVPTPHIKTGFDLTYVDQVMPHIADGAVVVIKSTVLPGTTDAYQKKYPKLKMLFSPEFLTEKTANEDFIKPTRQIVGYTEQSKDAAQEILDMLPRAGYEAIMTAVEAEMVKYMNNVFYALKVTYANQIFDLCESLGIDYAVVRDGAITNEPWMGTNHYDVHFGEYRGYGGKCLPKDVRSLIDLGKQCAVDVSFLELMEKINNRRTQSE